MFIFLGICLSLGIESDEEIRRVPEIGVETAGPSASRPESGSGAATDRVQGSGEGHRKRGRNPADKESKRLKRYSLLAFTLLPLLLPLTPVVPIKYKTYLTFL